MVQAVDTSYLSIAELAALYRQREVSPVEVTQHLLERALGLQGAAACLHHADAGAGPGGGAPGGGRSAAGRDRLPLAGHSGGL